MSKWEMVKLGEICEVQSGGTPSRGNLQFWENGTISWVKISDISNKYLNKTNEKITQKGLENSSTKIFPKGTILYTIFATLGEVCILDIEACTNQAIAGLLIKDKRIKEDFIYYFLLSIKSHIMKIGRGVAQNNINLSILKNIQIPLPPLEEQEKIAKELDKITNLIEKRKSQLEKLDLLVKAKFIEMFGDPVTNPMGWEVKKLGEICTKIGSGSTPRGGKESYHSEGISLIRSLNVHMGYFKYLDLAFIDDKQAHDLRNVTIEENDVLFNITGASIARSCIVPSEILPARVNQHVSILRCKTELLVAIFLNNLLINPSYQIFLNRIGEANGATRQAITKEQLENFSVITPPINLQNNFAEYINKVEKLKTKQQQGLNQLEILYKSRMQEYFE